MRAMRYAWALALGLALVVAAGFGAILAGQAGAPGTGTTRATTQTDASADPMNPWPSTPSVNLGDSDIGVDRNNTNQSSTLTIGLEVRWGYLDDPAVAELGGRWEWNANQTGGAFMGEWRWDGTRIHGSLQGRFSLPGTGPGEFRGTWDAFGSRIGGHLWGDWVRDNQTDGSFDGKWNYTSGRPGGALAGHWTETTSAGGMFRGVAIHAPTLSAVDWDGSLHTSNGTVKVLRTLRWETGGDRRLGTDDQLLPQTDPATVEWRAATTGEPGRPPLRP